MELTSRNFFRRLKTQLDYRYLIYGKEEFMVERCSYALRSYVKGQGYLERTALSVTSDFEWRQFEISLSGMSLFASKKVVELRLPASGNVGVKGANYLVESLDSVDESTLLIVIAGALGKKTKQTKWFKTWAQKAILIDNPELSQAEFKNWIQRQLSRNQIEHEAEVVNRLAYYFEGNMLAAANELRKIKMGFDGTRLTTDEINRIVNDQARFNRFALIDACMEGKSAQALRLLYLMRNEGSEAGGVLWLLAREANLVYQVACAVANKQSAKTVYDENWIWPARQKRISAAARRLGAFGAAFILQQLANADRILKGRNQEPVVGTIWDECERIILGFCHPKNYI